MANTNRVIVMALDGSYHSDFAFNWYKDHIQHDNDYLIVVTCLERHVHGIYDATELATQIQREIDEHEIQVQAIQEKLTKAGIKGEVVKTAGRAGEVVIKVAHERQAAMIICGARGHGTFRRTVMGSNSDYIMNHSDIPVVVCRHKRHMNKSSESK